MEISFRARLRPEEEGFRTSMYSGYTCGEQAAVSKTAAKIQECFISLVL
jgi:hypothetical protein